MHACCQTIALTAIIIRGDVRQMYILCMYILLAKIMRERERGRGKRKGRERKE